MKGGKRGFGRVAARQKSKKKGGSTLQKEVKSKKEEGELEERP